MAAVVQWVRHSIGLAGQLPQFNGCSSMAAVQWRRFKNSGSMGNIQRQRFGLQFNGNKVNCNNSMEFNEQVHAFNVGGGVGLFGTVCSF